MGRLRHAADDSHEAAPGAVDRPFLGAGWQAAAWDDDLARPARDGTACSVGEVALARALRESVERQDVRLWFQDQLADIADLVHAQPTA